MAAKRRKRDHFAGEMQGVEVEAAMGWAVQYLDYEIYPSVTPVRAGVRGIVGFVPVASVYRRGDHEKPVVELGPTEDVTFRDAAAATEYIVSRAKGLIDGDESALLLPGQLRS